MKRVIFTGICIALLICCGTVFAEKAAVPNPWTETGPKGFVIATGLDMHVPEGAEDVIYRVNRFDKLGEIQFVLDGISFTARIKAVFPEEDISGLYYTWESEEEVSISYCPGKTFRAKDGENTVDLCLWYDVVPGVMYSLSCSAPDLDGFDITAVAEQVFFPLQGEA